MQCSFMSGRGTTDASATGEALGCQQAPLHGLRLPGESI